MAKNKRPKYLDKETPELLALLNEILAGEDPDTDKAAKIASELKNRMAETTVANVDEALQAAADQMTKALNTIKAAYDAEVAMIGSDAAEDDEDEDEEDEKPAPKAKKGKKAAPPPEDDEDEEDDDEEDEDDETDYSSMSQKALKAELRKRGIRVKKGMDKDAMVKALEADDAE